MSYEYAIKRTRTGEILYEGMGLNAVSAIMREFEEDGAREGAWQIVRRPRPCPWDEIEDGYETKQDVIQSLIENADSTLTFDKDRANVKAALNQADF